MHILITHRWAHALISDSTALGIKTNCNFSHIGAAFKML